MTVTGFFATLTIVAFIIAVCLKIADSYNTGPDTRHQTRHETRRQAELDRTIELVRQRQQARLAAFQHREGTVAKPHGPDVRAHEDPPLYQPPPTADPEEEK